MTERTTERKYVLVLQPEAEGRFQMMLNRIGSNDGARLIRMALYIAEWAIEETEKGNRIAAINEGGPVSSIDIYEQP